MGNLYTELQLDRKVYRTLKKGLAIILSLIVFFNNQLGTSLTSWPKSRMGRVCRAEVTEL